MGLLGRFFNMVSAKLLEQMHHDTDVIQMALSTNFSRSLIKNMAKIVG